MEDLVQAFGNLLPGIIALVALIIASGFFSSSETALFYLTHEDLRSFRTGGRRERIVAHLMSNPDRLLTAVLFWNLLINLGYFAVSIVLTAQLSRGHHEYAAGVFSVLSLLGIILFGEVIPKSVAVTFRRPLARLVSLPLVIAVTTLDPILPRLNRLTRALRRAFWQNVPTEPYLDADDLERAVETSKMRAEIVQQETEVLHNVLDLSEILVEEVMRPRVTYTGFDPPVAFEAVRTQIPRTSYLVVNESGSDDVAGVIRLGTQTELPARNLETRAEDVVYVPWCSSLAYTLQLLRDRFCSAAAVINEYGVTIGIVTYDDIIDTILTPHASRTKRALQREPVLEIAPGRFHVDGLTTLRYLSKRMGISYEPESDMHLTVAGLFQEELQHIPRIGDECSWKGFLMRVIDVTRQGRVRVMLLADVDPLPVGADRSPPGPTS